MTHRIARIVVALSIFALGTASIAQQPRATTAPAHSMISKGLDPSGALVLTSQKSAVLQIAGTYKRVSVGSPDIADVSAIGPTQILVTGKSPGETSLTIWGDDDHFDMIDVRVTVPVAAAAPSPRAPAAPGAAPAALATPA